MDVIWADIAIPVTSMFIVILVQMLPDPVVKTTVFNRFTADLHHRAMWFVILTCLCERAHAHISEYTKTVRNRQH